MTLAASIALITIPVLISITVGCVLLRRAFQRQKLMPEEFAFAAAWVFMVGSLVWLGASLSGSTILGFGAPWTWFTAAHFAFAGYGALTVTCFCCRVVTKRRSQNVLRFLLIAHPIAYLVIAAGILGFRYCDEIGSAAYLFIFLSQLVAVVFGASHRMARGPLILAVIALAVPLVTMIPALAWAWGRPIFDLGGMVRYHGIVNAIGHVGLGIFAFVWGRVPSHSTFRKPNHLAL